MPRSEAEEAAHRYADANWPVFPVASGDKLPAIPSAHPPGDKCAGECGQDGHGFKDATTDHAKIQGWWKAQERANVGIATGTPGPDVLDVDVKGDKSGYPAWNKIRSAGLADDPGAIIQTPSGGLHAYFKGTEQGNGRMPDQFIDYRGKGGYVVAPGSTVGGRPYEVVKHQVSAATFDWAAAKALLEPQRERRQPVATDTTDLDRLARHVARLQEGNRNDGLFWAANRAVEAGHDPEALADAALSTGMTAREVTRTLDSARKTANRQPQREAAGL
jgi:Bifunctional DNA primase/polymerase, N-terminal